MPTWSCKGPSNAAKIICVWRWCCVWSVTTCVRLASFVCTSVVREWITSDGITYGHSSSTLIKKKLTRGKGMRYSRHLS